MTNKSQEAKSRTVDRSANRNRNEAEQQLRQARVKLIAAGKEAQAAKVLEAIEVVSGLDMTE